MKRCWDAKADVRPSFAELVTQLSSQLGVIADYLDFSAPGQDEEDEQV